MNGGDDGGKLNRRHFLSRAAMDPAIYTVPSQRLAAFGQPSTRKSYATLQSLPPSAIRPEWWLRECLNKQANELAISLLRTSEPLRSTDWAGDGKPNHDGLWACEDTGYFLQRDEKK
jgi:hypothetical protein